MMKLIVGLSGSAAGACCDSQKHAASIASDAMDSISQIRNSVLPIDMRASPEKKPTCSGGREMLIQIKRADD